MKDFNAQEAKKIVESLYSDELHNTLTDIKFKVEKGETVLHVYKPLQRKTIDVLREKGFNVATSPSIAIQRDNLYYTITWW